MPKLQKKPTTSIDASMLPLLLDLPVNIYWMNKQGIMLGYNPYMLKELGISAGSNLIGKHCTDFTSQEAWKNSKLVMEKKQTLQFNETHTKTDGKKIVYLSIKMPLFDKKNAKKVIGITGISINITKIKQHEEQIRAAKEKTKHANEELINAIAQLKYKVTGQPSKTLDTQQNTQDVIDYLEGIIAALPGNIFWEDQNNRYLGCNNQLAKISKLKSREDIIGKTHYDLFDKHLADLTMQIDQKVIATGKEITMEESGLDINNNPATYLSQKKPLFDKEHHVIGLLGVSLDITERKKAEAKIAQLEKEKAIIEAKRKTVSDLATSIAHEIGNLLAGVIINFQLLDNHLRSNVIPLLDKNSDDYQKTTQALKDVEENLRNAKFMFESIKLNIRSSTIDKSQFTVSSIAAGIQTVLTNCFPGEDLISKIHWDKKMDFKYIGLPNYTCNILINLIKNALYFIKEQNKGAITIKLKKGKQFNSLIFEDTAKGIDKKFLSKIFTTFSTTRKGGMGVGLMFCKRIMQEYGGDITCESKLHKYTRFILTFPVVMD